jgi:gliding motility-associated lipoprotein GldH
MRNTAFISFFFLLSLAACGPESLVNATTPIKGGEWAFEDSRKLEVAVSDTLTPFDFYVLVRHDAQYPYQNLILYFKTYYPNNTYTVDTIDCPLAAPSGRWLGNGLGDLLDNRIMFKRNVQFPQSGAYNFELQHAMRPDTVCCVHDIGLLIQRAGS